MTFAASSHDPLAFAGSAAALAPAVLDALPAHVCVLDEVGQILWVNRSWRQFTAENGGRPESTSEGSNYLGACGPAERGEGAVAQPAPDRELLCGFTGALREVLAGRRQRAEAEYPCHAPHEQCWFVVEATALQGPGSARAVVAHHPITLRRLADMRQREELRLQSLGTLAGGIAHDFNNLLSVIHGRSRMLGEDLGRGHPATVHLASLQTAATSATSLVAKILAFGRGETGEPRAQDTVPIVRDAVELFRTGLPAGVRLVADIAPGPLVGVVDATDLTQVVLNLCRNAADALLHPHGEITVRLHAGDGPRASADARAPTTPPIELNVLDNGVGIDERLRERIFEPFFSTKPRGQGTGLGLSIVHGIVNRLGGRIEVHSQPGTGSRFEICLPQAPQVQPLPQPAAAESDLPALAAAAAGITGRRVLLVDDDEVVGMAIEAFLQRAGWDPHRFVQATEALSELRGGPQPFDLVVTDHAMPDMTGLDLALEVARHSPALPLVLVSGYIDESLQTAAVAAGAVAVLRKERVYDELLPLLERLRSPRAP